jgi:hypothetical protein
MRGWTLLLNYVKLFDDMKSKFFDFIRKEIVMDLDPKPVQLSVPKSQIFTPDKVRYFELVNVIFRGVGQVFRTDLHDLSPEPQNFEKCLLEMDGSEKF